MFNKSNGISAFPQAASRDEGLRKHMVAVYRYMCFALLLSGGVAYTVASSQALVSMFLTGPLSFLTFLAPLGIVFWLNASASNMSFAAVQGWFWAFAAIMGISLSTVLLSYTGISIARTFMITASLFGVMSIYGHVTKNDLSSFGSFLMMGLWGMIIATLVNIFLVSPMIYFVTSMLGVLIFTGLAAYDTQKIKDSYYAVSGGGESYMAKAAVFGALMLYMDFINLFLSLLRLTAQRK
jgi:FtsH-binding integral membrane protein